MLTAQVSCEALAGLSVDRSSGPLLGFYVRLQCQHARRSRLSNAFQRFDDRPLTTNPSHSPVRCVEYPLRLNCGQSSSV